MVRGTRRAGRGRQRIRVGEGVSDMSVVDAVRVAGNLSLLQAQANRTRRHGVARRSRQVPDAGGWWRSPASDAALLNNIAE